MWPSLVKIQYTELNLSCGNDPVVNNYIYSNSDLDLWPNDPKINMVFPLRQGNHVAKFGKDPMLCGNDPVVKNSIYSNIDLWPNDPKINRILPLPRAIMWSIVVKIQYTELKLCGNDPVVKKYIYSNGDLDLWPNDPKINKVLPLPQGNHVAKFVNDPIYKTKVTQSHNTARLEAGV
jgi:hypothetical protein